VEKLNGSFGTLGYVIIGFFVLSWVASVSIYKWRGYDHIEANEQMPVSMMPR
jgi:high-affinity nickel-transport protein